MHALIQNNQRNSLLRLMFFAVLLAALIVAGTIGVSNAVAAGWDNHAVGWAENDGAGLLEYPENPAISLSAQDADDNWRAIIYTDSAYDQRVQFQSTLMCNNDQTLQTRNIIITIPAGEQRSPDVGNFPGRRNCAAYIRVTPYGGGSGNIDVGVYRIDAFLQGRPF